MQFDLKIGGKFAENVEINVNMFSGEKMGKCIYLVPALLSCLHMHRIYSSNISSGQIRRIFVNRQLKIFKIPHQHQHSFTETDATAASNIEQPIV